MSQFELAADCYLAPSPAGAYFAVSSDAFDPARSLLLNIMRNKYAEPLALSWLQELSGESEDDAIERLVQLQQTRLVQGLDHRYEPPQGPLEDALPALLGELVLEGGQVSLADQHGLTLASHGFNAQQAEELAGLSANLAQLHDRHQHLLDSMCDLSTAAWALVGADGSSQIGFWPLFVGSHRFVLIIRGVASLNRPALVSLVWTLIRRYAHNPSNEN